MQGIIEHDGSGLSLTAGSTVVDLTNFTVNPGNSKLYGDVTVNGTVAATQAYLFDLHGGSLKPLQVNGNEAVLTGTTVHISPHGRPERAARGCRHHHRSDRQVSI